MTQQTLSLEPREPGSGAPGTGVQLARGARHAEAVILAAVQEHVRAVRADERLLAQPLRIVVPSRSLREHVAAAIVRHAGHGVAGIVVQTLNGLAHEILRRAGEELRTGEALLPALVRQEARAQQPLRAALGDVEDGFSAALGSVSDLLDAGFEPAQADAFADCLAESEPALRERGRALGRVAVGALAGLAKLGLAHRAALHRRAAELLAGDAGFLPSRSVWIHGFADATGTATELLRALVLYARAQLLLDQPPDPSEPAATDSGARFTRRLANELAGIAGARECEIEPPPPATIRLRGAAGAQGEARAAAEQIRVLLDGGARPEGIGVVVRQLEPYAVPLRIQLRRFGVPFSGAPGAVGPLAPAGRRLRALLALVAHAGSTPADRWLDAWGGIGRERRADLRVAFHALGLGRLRDVAALDVESRLRSEEWLPLPVRQGFGEAEEGEDEVRARRRGLSRATLEEAVAAAASLEAALAAAAVPAHSRTLFEHLTQLDSLRGESLGWRAANPATRCLEEALGSLRGELEGGLPLVHEDFVALLERALRDAGRVPIGGEGGGVRLLSVTDARACCFDHLFVLGMNRDLFPRAVSEDPLLSDALRRRLEAVLPDVPVKARGFDEERYLFAQLVSASPEIWLSWQVVSDDGKEKTVSPFVERLRLGGVGEVLALAASPVGGAPGAKRHTALDHAVRSGLAGRRRASDLELALADGRRTFGADANASELAAVARARTAVVRELERATGAGGGLGPFFGFVGPRAGRDSRGPEPAVTVLERLALCPWQTFLKRVLGIEPVPDARGELPALSGRLVGNLLHRVLERVAEAAGVPSGGSLAEALARQPRDVPWPAPVALEALLEAEARAVVRGEGITLPGFARALTERVAAHLELARAADFSPAARAVAGVEVGGEVTVETAEGPRRLRFRADRLDRVGERFSLTDYKSGRPFSTAADAERRRDALVDAVARAKALQGAAYAFCARGAEGRYLFARPGVETDRAGFVLAGNDEEARECFTAAARVLLDAWDQGHFPPRLLAPDWRSEPRDCSWCDVSEACLRGDSSARRRLRRWLEAPPPAVADTREAGMREAGVRALWQLAEPR